MRRKSQTIKLRILVCIILLPVVFSLISVCHAEEQWNRSIEKPFEVLFRVNPVTIEDTISSKYGATIEIEDTTFYSFGAGMNVDDHFNLNFDAAFFTNFDFKLVDSGGVIDHADVDSMSMNLNVDYNFFKSRFTPLVSAGIGFIRFDGNWDNTFIGNFSEVDFTYNLGIGARWDITDAIAFNAIYRNMWVEIQDADDATKFDGISFNLLIFFK